MEQVQPAGPARTIPIAPSVPSRRQGMAMQPEDADFAQAAVWRVKLPAGVDAGRDLRLRVRYTGDVVRAYLGDKLLDDDFYSARPFEIGLRRYGPAVYQDGLMLKILPLRRRRAHLLHRSFPAQIRQQPHRPYPRRRRDCRDARSAAGGWKIITPNRWQVDARSPRPRSAAARSRAFLRLRTPARRRIVRQFTGAEP